MSCIATVFFKMFFIPHNKNNNYRRRFKVIGTAYYRRARMRWLLIAFFYTKRIISAVKNCKT